MQERNIYLARTHPNMRHHYSQASHYSSFDQQTGKYFLECQNRKTQIYQTGKLRTRFTPHVTGFLNFKSRYTQSQINKNAMHYVPDLKSNKSLYAPVTEKFCGYAQFPRQNDTNIPNFLDEFHQTKFFLRRQKPKKKRTMITQEMERAKNHSELSNYKTTSPKTRSFKKRCYNNQCRQSSNEFPQKGQQKSSMLKTTFYESKSRDYNQ